MCMDILEYLKKRQSELEYVSHPMSDKTEGFKYLYCYGLGVMAVGHMKAITELQTYFDKLLDSICISQKSRNQIIVDINNYFDFRISEFFRVISTKEVQYCFMSDIYKIYRLSLWSQEYCKGILDNYLKVFRFSQAECAFFENFNDAAQEKNIKKAVACYREFQNQGYDMSYQTLVYFFPEFELEEYYNDINIKTGKTVVLDKPTIIEGDISIERGGSLLIIGAFVNIKGHIHTVGGRVRLKDARIKVEECSSRYLMDFKETAVVHIENSFIDCGRNCGLLRQEAGRLIISGSEIRRTAKERAISFNGLSFLIENTQFDSNMAGSVELFGCAKMLMRQCTFNDSSAEYGGAIQSESIGNTKIEKCNFNRCSAVYLGSAIYFKYQKFGQYVKECICNDCTPGGGSLPWGAEIFNVYDDDLELKIR